MSYHHSALHFSNCSSHSFSSKILGFYDPLQDTLGPLGDMYHT
jgi:hypothetical protein